MKRETNPAAIRHRLRRAARSALAELRPEDDAARPPAIDTPVTDTEPNGTPVTPDGPAPRAVPDGPVRAPSSPVPTLSLRAAVAASDRVSALLAPEWDQQALRPGATDLAGVDLVLLEGVAGWVPGWTEAEVVDLLSTAKGAGVPTALWVTDDEVPGDWSAAVDAVGAATRGATDALRARGRDVHHWAPAAQPRSAGLAREDAATERRSGVLMVLEASHPGDEPTLRLVDEALSRMKSRDTTLITRSEAPLPTGLQKRLGTGDPHPADASVLLDLSATSPAAAWTTVAAAMAQTPLVGTAEPVDVPEEIGRLVPFVGEQKQLRSELVARLNQPELVSREGVVLQRAVLAGHTGAHRARAIAGAAGLTVPEIRPATISAVVPTNRTHELDNVFANLGRQDHPAVELVLVLHGLDTNDADLRRRATEAGVTDLQIIHADASLTLGACMNLGVDAAGGRYVAKMDDDNLYGPRYLSDLLATFGYTDAGIVGKWAHYVWLKSSGGVVLRYPDSEHRYERRIQGGSMLFDGDVVRDVRFSDIPRAVDSDILDRSMARGVRVYSGDRHNYVSVRGDDRQAHTWTVADSTFLTATGRLLFYGDPTTHVSL